MTAGRPRFPLVLALALGLPACDSGKSSDGDEAAEDTSAAEGNGDDAESTDGHETETGDELMGCAAEDRDEDFSVGLSKSSPMFAATFVSANPAPPIKGDNSWVVEFTDADEVPLVDPEIVVIPMMPDHGHGTPVAAVVTATTTPGQFTIDPVNLFMEGLWEITFEVTVAGEQDSVVFKFCVE